MNDMERISKITNLLNSLWLRQPDTRFNQLIVNLQMEYALFNNSLEKVYRKEDCGNHRQDLHFKEMHIPDLYQLEDDKFIEFLEKKAMEII